MDPAVLRILDANLNRAREGLRVLEEHARLVVADPDLTGRIKTIRHALADIAAALGSSRLLAERDIHADVGIGVTTPAEGRRADSAGVALAAMKRASEALRCLEEYGKLVNPTAAEQAGRLRYETYALEQELFLAAPRRRRLQEARLHVLLTPRLCRRDWFETAEAAVAGGADVIQLRDKDVADDERLAHAEKLRRLTADRGVLLIVNDRADVARLVAADGVHVGQTDLSVAQARHVVGPTVVVGKSTHSVREARDALAERPDYVAVGPMFASPTKPQIAVQGPSLLREVRAIADVPVVAIGGICSANIADVRRAGATQVAVSHAVIAADDPAAAARELRRLLECPVDA